MPGFGAFMERFLFEALPQNLMPRNRSGEFRPR